jgi:hypothetical protein
VHAAEGQRTARALAAVEAALARGAAAAALRGLSAAAGLGRGVDVGHVRRRRHEVVDEEGDVLLAAARAGIVRRATARASEE